MTFSKCTHAVAVCAITVLACAGMAAAERLGPQIYAAKTAIKLALFLALPVIYLAAARDKQALALLRPPEKRGLAVGAALGAAVCALIVGGYFALSGIIDFSAVAGGLEKSDGVTAENFVAVALYITFINSFVEEFFFRGFAYSLLGGAIGQRAAGIFSAAMFALFHVAIITGWFHPLVTAAIIGALFVAGLIFNRLMQASGSLLSPWLLHMGANAGINIVGLLLLGVI